ncbi:MAG: tRNA pseudouridine(54/55) synthase Pus10 [Candidatus Hodarchaeales archaeon]|jgi:tRNA pseudouridine synthase 10
MILSQVLEILQEYTLCTSCLGRQFGTLLSNSSNRARGESLLLSLALELYQGYKNQEIDIKKLIPLFKTNYPPIMSIIEKTPELSGKSFQHIPCHICQEMFSDTELIKIVEKVKAHAENYEFATFLIGSSVSPDVIEREEDVRARFGLQFGEALKSDYNREVGKRLINYLPGKEVEFTFPDVLFVINPLESHIQVNPNPLFIEGRYRKLVRDIPQAIWHCSSCRGKGCDKCNYSGRNYPDAIEEYISPYFLRAAKGEETKFHGAGREDVDALMLGKGRPFIVEIRKPKKRSLNLTEIEQSINDNANGRISVTIIGESNRNTVRNLKGQSRRMGKKYRMKVNLQQAIEIDNEKIRQELIGEINQQTPTRVLHRRADLIRMRRVFDINITQLSDQPQALEVIVYCEGGLYVKELMHGDNNRTKPSLASVLNTEVTVEYLDVLEVESLQEIDSTNKKS